MFKKLFKKIGKKIKKIGKAIGKPFKKLMKTKLGKVIGTIGMMMIGGWMMSGAKAFTSSLFSAQGLGTAFGEGISAMGKAAQASYKTITDGITGMFTKNGKTTVEAGANNLQKEIVEKAGTDVTTTDITKQAVDTTKTKVRKEGTITASGKVVGDDAIAKSIEKSLANLPEAGSPGDMFKWDSATQKYIPKTEQELMTGKLELAIQEEPAKYIAQKKGAFGLRTDDITTRALKDPVTGEAIIPKGFREVDSLRKPSLLDKVYEMPFAELNKEYGLGAKPLKSFERLPGILREGTVGEAKAVYDFTRPIPDPYIPGSSNMTGAISALSENDARLYSTMPMNQMINQTSLPSPSVIGIADYMNNTRKAGFVWDTALLATQPSSLPSVPRTPGISF
tara:strand:+ start:955 stop:2133 length:1179 start_codon:yes stop_codon:yes gene_type:complete